MLLFNTNLELLRFTFSYILFLKNDYKTPCAAGKIERPMHAEALFLCSGILIQLSRCSVTLTYRILDFDHVTVDQIIAGRTTEVQFSVGFFDFFSGNTDIVQSLSRC